MSHTNPLLEEKPCGCGQRGFVELVDGVAVDWHEPQCPDRRPPRQYTWTSGGKTRQGNLAAMVADRNSWQPDLFTVPGTRTLPVHTEDGVLTLEVSSRQRSAESPVAGWLVIVGPESVQYDTPNP